MPVRETTHVAVFVQRFSVHDSTNKHVHQLDEASKFGIQSSADLVCHGISALLESLIHDSLPFASNRVIVGCNSTVKFPSLVKFV